MKKKPVVGWGAAGALLVGGMAVPASAADTKAPATAPAQAPTTAPTSRPASGIVLVRVGDKATITQEDFNTFFYGGAPMAFEPAKEKIARELLERKWLSLYLDDHPEIDPGPGVKAEIEAIRKRENINTEAEFRTWLLARRRTPELLYDQKRLLLAQARLADLGEKKCSDEEAMKRLFEAQPADFNGTELDARHILIGVAAYDTPEQKQAKREKAEQLRQDLISGKVAWEEAVKESTDITRTINGRLGTFNRHERLMEDLAAAAFKLEVDKIGDLIETPFGFHILQVTRRAPGKRSYEESKASIKRWLRREPYINAIHEAQAKYPAVGVQAPETPTRPPWFPPATQSDGKSRPKFLMPAPPIGHPGARSGAARPATRPGAGQTVRPGVSRPGPRPPGAVRPAMPPLPAGPASQPR